MVVLSLVEGEYELGECMGEETLFSDMGDQAFIPKPIREYPQTHFLEVSDV